MSDDRKKVVPFRPRAADLETIIHAIAIADRYVYLGAHTRDRMDERTITRPDVLRVLEIGSIKGPISTGLKPGEWKCKVVARVKGSREIGVVTIVVEGKKIFIKTVEWEDLK
ncbi:DUF4258 domain-containing protein [Flavisphingomonas formosensis]|uniref:DUF4258 domain-containing protein n=1 Tax=Flavisphingomonas formosensis TaxID=861534 RepID=UPI0038CDAE8B